MAQDSLFDDHDSEPRVAIGIDLGTMTSSVARLVDDREIECFDVDESRAIMPSALYIGQDVHAGEAALRRGLEDPEGVVEAFKREMGDPHFHRKIRHHWVPPEVLSALLLDEIRVRVERLQDAEVSGAVITVPAYFDERRRRATLEAGRIAGLNVLDIVNEPVAAALADLFERGALDDAAKPQKTMVYDLGGGTFDVSILEVNGSEIVTLAADGDIRLGGRDFDEKIVEMITERFERQHGVDPRSDFAYAQHLWRIARDAKHELSNNEKTSVVCSFAGMRMGVEITRADFEGLIEAHLERTILTAVDALGEAGLDTWGKLDRILLVGGSSRIPAVSRRLAAATGIKPTVCQTPDLMVAKGAALFAAMSTSERLKPLQLVNVNAHSLGIAGVDPVSGKPVNRIMIPRNSRLPARKRQKFVTKAANQKTIQVKIVEGENENPDFCIPVGTCVVTLSPGLPARTEALVTMQVSSNGTLSVACHIPITKDAAHAEIRRDGLMELESLPIWRDRLLRGILKAEPSAEAMPALPTFDAPDQLDHESIAKRIDYLCQIVGERCAQATVSVEALGAQRHYAGALREYQVTRYVLEQIRNKIAQTRDALELSKLKSYAAAVNTYLSESGMLLTYSRIALGDACVKHDCVPETLTHEADEIRGLRETVERWGQQQAQGASAQP